MVVWPKSVTFPQMKMTFVIAEYSYRDAFDYFGWPFISSGWQSMDVNRFIDRLPALQSANAEAVRSRTTFSVDENLISHQLVGPENWIYKKLKTSMLHWILFYRSNHNRSLMHQRDTQGYKHFVQVSI